MAQFTVDPSVMLTKASELSRHAEEYDTISAQLKTTATTMGTAYESADNRAYVGRMEECAKDLKNMADKLRSISETIKAQANAYIAQEEHNTTQANKLPG